MERLGERNFPHEIRGEGMASIVFRCPVAPTKIVGILGENRIGGRKYSYPSVRDFVQRVSVSVVDLKQGVAPPGKSLFERNDHAVVVGNGIRLKLRYPAKSWIRAGRN